MASVGDVINKNRVGLAKCLDFNNLLFDHLRELNVLSLQDVEQITKRNHGVHSDMASDILQRLEKRNKWSSLNKFCFALRETKQEHLVTSYMRGEMPLVKIDIQIDILSKRCDPLWVDQVTRVLQEMVLEDRNIDTWHPDKISDSLIAPFRDVCGIRGSDGIRIDCYSTQAESELRKMRDSISQRVIRFYTHLFKDKSPLSPDEIRIQFREAQDTIPIEGKEQQICLRAGETPRTLHELLEEILRTTCTMDSFVYLLSVVGFPRTGRSFLLNYLMRYLQALESSNTANWLGEEEEKLTGFNWSNSGEPTTNGIVIWDRPFIVRDERGVEVKVVLVDAEGLSEENPEKSEIVQDVIACLSTGQILNMLSPVKKGHFEKFKFESFIQPFSQKKMTYILVRDHKNKRKYRHGNSQGKEFLHDVCKTSPGIDKCCECFLLPHPGSGIDDITDEDDEENYNGCHSALTEDFKKHLKGFFDHLAKDICKVDPITGHNLLELIEGESSKLSYGRPAFAANWLQVSPLPGSPVQLLSFSGSDGEEKDTMTAICKGLFLDIETMTQVFKHTDERPAVCLAFAGAGRLGKSFFLNYVLRYLWALELGKEELWMEGQETPLNGFHWCGGEEPVTEGIQVWNHPFTITLDDGRKIVLVVLDTQGQFDQRSSKNTMNIMLALSTSFTKIQVYNVSQRINETDLEALEDIVTAGSEVRATVMEAAKDTVGWLGKQLMPRKNYGPLVDSVELRQESSDKEDAEDVCIEDPSEADRKTPGPERLVFLVRDWYRTTEYNHGSTGGQNYLNMKLSVDATHAENKLLRENIRTSFKEVECFLMPEPGMKAKESTKTFDGRLSDLDQKFKTQLHNAVPFIVGREFIQHSPSDLLLMRQIPDALQLHVESLRCSKDSLAVSTREGRLIAQDYLTFSQELSNFQTVFTQEKQKNMSDEAFEELIRSETSKAIRMLQSRLRYGQMQDEFMKQFKEQLETSVMLSRRERELEQQRIAKRIDQHNVALMKKTLKDFSSQAKGKLQELQNISPELDIGPAIEIFVSDIREDVGERHVKFEGTSEERENWEARLRERLKTQAELMVKTAQRLQSERHILQGQENKKIMESHLNKLADTLQNPLNDITCVHFEVIREDLERDLVGNEDIRKPTLDSFEASASLAIQSWRLDKKKREAVEEAFSMYCAHISQCESDYDNSKLLEVHEPTLRKCTESLNGLLSLMTPDQAEESQRLLVERCMNELHNTEAIIRENKRNKDARVQKGLTKGKMKYLQFMNILEGASDIFEVLDMHANATWEAVAEATVDNPFHEYLTELLKIECLKYITSWIIERKQVLQMGFADALSAALEEVAKTYREKMDKIYSLRREYHGPQRFESDHSESLQHASRKGEEFIDRIRGIEFNIGHQIWYLENTFRETCITMCEELRQEYETKNKLNNPRGLGNIHKTTRAMLAARRGERRPLRKVIGSMKAGFGVLISGLACVTAAAADN